MWRVILAVCTLACIQSVDARPHLAIPGFLTHEERTVTFSQESNQLECENLFSFEILMKRSQSSEENIIALLEEAEEVQARMAPCAGHAKS
jgi:hypothetical protein